MKHLKRYKAFLEDGTANATADLIAEDVKSSKKIVFRKQGDKDIGACIGIPHGGIINLSNDIIERIKKIPNLHFYAEGSAAKNPNDEPNMMPFINKNFPNYGIESKSWDDITEENNKGIANPNNNIVYTFMQHAYNDYVGKYYSSHTNGTMLDAMANSSRPEFPPNSPKSPDERLNWLTNHMKKAGFYDKLNKPYDKNTLIKIMDEMENSVYPNGQETPNTSTYFGKMQQEIENERNQTIYDLMGDGGVCIAGEGHVDELKQQFPNLEYVM